MSNDFGISDLSYTLLLEAFKRYGQVEEVILFGSRAKGNYKKGSDIDLAIKGKNCTASLALDIKGYINEELAIPYMVDVVDYNSLTHTELKEHIDRMGIVFYSRQGSS
jgi:predicted nucleotidyltransferase